MIRAIFKIQGHEEIQVLNTHFPISKCFQKLARHAFSKIHISLQEMVERKIFPVNDLVLVQREHLNSFKFYVKMPFFSIFCNSSYRQRSYSDRPSTGILVQTASITASLFRVVDS